MLRVVSENDLDRIRAWRNSPDVRRVMFSDHEITQEEHLSWWKRIKNDSTKKQLMYVWNGIDAGVVNYFDIDPDNKICHWGFYLSSEIDNQLQRMQAWQSLEKEAIEYAFRELACSRLICESFRFNQPVIEMHKRFGFEEVGVETREKGGIIEEVVITEITPDKYFSLFSAQNNYIEAKKKEYKRLSKRCLVFGSANLDFFAASLKDEASKYKVNLSITEVPYGQYKIQVNDPESVACKEPHDYVLFIERLDDLINFNEVLTEQVLANLQDRWHEYLELIRHARGNVSGNFLIANPVTINSWLSSSNPAVKENAKIKQCVEEMNSQLNKLCQSISDAYVIDLASVVDMVGRNIAHPGKYWYMARAPFSMSLNAAMSKQVLGIMMALEAKTARVIALDLDNTLWKGVIGDDGLEGIALGGDYPGNVFQAIQKILTSFRDRGIALVLCSKNTEQVAFEVFEKHPDMIIKKDDLTAWRVNWVPKPQNLKELSEELDLGLASFCFIDDNPAEREEMRMSFPEVFVPEMPVEISDWPEYIINLPELSDIGLTQEDRKRVDQYKIRSKIKQGQKQAGSREDFLKTLDMEMTMEAYSSSNQQRVLQLIKKTNQFNATTRRHSETELKKLLENGECYAIRLKDALGSNEIIGVLIFLYNNECVVIDTLLLSCRVLGRGVETAILAWLYTYVKQNGYKKIIGEIIPTERNMPVLELYANHSFAESGKNRYELNLLDGVIELPIWIRLGKNED